MPYKYEIFLSYPRRPMVMRWLDKHFEPILSQWLHEELLARGHTLPHRQPQIFRDTREITAGELWPRSLREAARDSRCALAILLPSYFESAHCRAEWETFRIRGREFKRNLLVPVRFHDCLQMPFAEQVFDLSTYTALVEDTQRWVEFHDKVARLAGQVADRIVSAPPYPDDPECASWLTMDIPEPPVALPIFPGRLIHNDD